MKTIRDMFNKNIKMLDDSRRLCEQVMNYPQEGYAEEYNALLQSLISNCEKTAIKMRELPVRLCLPDCSRITADALAEVHGIQIDLLHSKWLRILMPCLIPSKATSAKKEFIFAPLQLAVKDFLTKTSVYLHYHKCVIVIRHLHDRTQPLRQISDNDNLDVKTVVDILRSYFLTDDSSWLCSHFYQSKMHDRNGTEIFIVPEEDFGVWYTCLN